MAAERSPEPERQPVEGVEGEDQLSPGKLLGDHARMSRSERIGDNTPTGPASSPPVDPDTV
jgi:hypothetical protein